MRIRITLLAFPALVAGVLMFPTAALADAPTFDVTQRAYRNFYPYVHDGYRDRIAIDVSPYYDGGLPGDVNYCDSDTWSARVTNTQGGGVRNLGGATRTGNGMNDVTLIWNGRKNDGSLARTGYYAVTVSMSFSDCFDWQGNPVSAPSVTKKLGAIHPTTGWLSTRHTKNRSGRYTTSRSSCANYGCVIESNGWGLWMQSFDYGISAAWNLSIPAGATNISCSITTSYTDGPHGRSCARIAPRTERVTMSLPTNSVVVVDAVHVSYTTRKRI